MLNLFLMIGAISIVISGIFWGAWTDGQQQRANFHSETGEHRNFRVNIGLVTAAVGLICFAIAALIYFF